MNNKFGFLSVAVVVGLLAEPVAVHSALPLIQVSSSNINLPRVQGADIASTVNELAIDKATIFGTIDCCAEAIHLESSEAAQRLKDCISAILDNPALVDNLKKPFMVFVLVGLLGRHNGADILDNERRPIKRLFAQDILEAYPDMRANLADNENYGELNIVIPALSAGTAAAVARLRN
ncbi:MAG: hypothetical protein LBL30_00305 [Holosporales bacterium]|nr:hypothetical protein [Holosporales bacterium]